MNNIDLLLHVVVGIVVVVATNCVCITEVMLGGKLYERSADRRGPFRDTRTTISVSGFVSLLFLVIMTYMCSFVSCLSSSVLERRPSLYSADKQYMCL